MDTDEEYLDDLLEAMNNSEQQNRTMKDAMKDVKKISDEVKKITKATDIPEMKSDTVTNDSDDWKASLDNILAQVDSQVEEDTVQTDVLEADGWAQNDVPQTDDMTQDDLAKLIDSIDSMQIDTEGSDDEELDDTLSDLLNMNFDTTNSKDVYAVDTNVEDINEEDDEVPKDVNLMDMNLMDSDSEDKEPVNRDLNDANFTDLSPGNNLNMEKMDVTDLVDNMDSTDADLAEINGLLKNVEKNENVNDDILELLESVKADSSDESDDSAFDIFDEHELKEVLRDGNQYINSAEELESIPEKKTKKKKRSKKEKNKKEKPKSEGGLIKKLFGGKKKAEDSDEDVELALDTEMEARGGVDAKDGVPEDIIREKDEKKPGLFSKLKGLLTEEADGFDENQDSVNGLKEINESEREEIKKEAQKKKEKKEKKGKKKEKAAPKKDDKKKKVKKVKKEKKPREVVIERPIISKKVLILMIALCATLLASIFILSNLLPEYEQRQRVHTAYNEKDYETVYKFLYNKRRNSDETIMYERADLILKLERRWKSYQNNMLLDQELEALHSLMQGVDYYHSLTGVEEYETQNELNILYQQICGALDRYGITPEEAVEINAYDDVTYTKRLTAIVNGTEFTAPGEEKAQEEAMQPQDILPEEEEIIGLDSDN
ncbi:hypothetical protein [Parablautia muri]|uniref:Uncharacterized protein n=1 Tax=Parablautia muri TaxID=2320879 RepID=A0A9X5BDV2_9FIRM|nr:hypothetical protein [Parablautia muri]NBJ91612.1 hypothetical protein [Parablautia muri]